MWNLIFPNKSKEGAKATQRPLLQTTAGLASKQPYKGKPGAIFSQGPVCPLTQSDHK